MNRPESSVDEPGCKNVVMNSRSALLRRYTIGAVISRSKGTLLPPAQDRNKLWIARKKLTALIRDEIAYTCQSTDQIEAELAYLSGYLDSRRKS